MSPKWFQPTCNLFSKEEKVESTQIKCSSTVGAKINNPDPDKSTNNQTISGVKLSYVMEGSRYKIYDPLFSVSYN